MATNWNAVLANINNASDILAILRKVLGLLDGKVDLTKIDEIINDITSMQTDVDTALIKVGNALSEFDTEAQETIQNIISAGLMEGFATEAELLATRPIVPKKYAKAEDTDVVWFWNKPEGSSDGNYWTSTGLSEYNRAINYVDANPLFKSIVLSTENLNDIKRTGIYVAPHGTPTLAKNFPTNEAGVFTPWHVMTGSTGSLVPEMYTSYSGKMWVRGTDSSGVTPTLWDQVITKSLFDTLISGIKNPIVLVTNTDVRTLTKSDTYLAYSDPSTPISTSNLPKAGEQYYVELFYSVSVRRMIAYSRSNNDVYIAWYWGTFGWSAWERLATEKDITLLQSQITALDYVKVLHDDLMNPFKETRIKGIGDSIMWGMGGSAGSPITPRNGDLNDVRNTLDTSISKTWFNLFRTWLAKTYGDGTVTQDKPGSGFTVNKIRTTWSDIYKVVKMNDKNGLIVNDANKLTNLSYDAETALKFHGSSMRLVNQTITTTRPTEMEVSFYGDNISIDYEKRPEGDSAGDIIEVYLDGSLHGTFNYFSSSYGDFSYDIATTVGQHTLRFKNISTNSASFVNIYGFTVNKKIYVSNDGIIGSSTKTWIDKGLYEGSLHPKDDFVFHMLGTNDRQSGGSLDGYNRRIRLAMDKIKNLAPSAKIILMASTYASNESESTYKFHMKQVTDVNAVLAKELNIPFIDHYKYCAQHLLDGEAIWSDGLHLNDLGNRLYFQNILNVLFKI
ncbi:SGNH/GDSL hydrolase family protein [Acinetobacter oleivorans]|uniref:SGNH/GDSL hydrolase family protein n=1 Tax=Acinetobacter oleivorans TaxID=1148157 RepID=UPI0015811514|nr:SGNH/GDSL hydrolase family protein [Acinetobacter oleivorans]NUG01446.1 SGNH/GDSL hydrolase family protein [Acinetobacter oleivorans]